MIISDSTNELKRGFRFNLRSLNVQNAFRAEAGMVLLAFRVIRKAQQLGVTDAKIYSDCMSVITRVKEIDSTINQAIKASIPSYDIWKEIHDIILVLTMEWDIMWVKAHLEREWGNCSPTEKGRKIQSTVQSF